MLAFRPQMRRSGIRRGRLQGKVRFIDHATAHGAGTLIRGGAAHATITSEVVETARDSLVIGIP